METKLKRIAEISKTRPLEKFNNIIHLINIDMLRMCHNELEGNKATGIDGVTKDIYASNLQENLENLLARLKKFGYRPQPVRRVYIPKPGSDKMRPLGIPTHEDKIVQMAMTKILTAIYEPHFLEYSYGFRTQRNCHKALATITYFLEYKRTNYIVDADIKSFFDNVNHEWLIKFIEHRISDEKFVRLLKRILKSGLVEDGLFTETEVGTPQGGVISPILANIYLHYVLDLWFEKKIKTKSDYNAHMVRYADDFVCCFQSKREAYEFYEELKERMNKFGLQMAEDKTKIVMFGKYANENSRRITGKKPETFDFCGFTHYCSLSHKGNFRVKRKTAKKKRTASKAKIKKWIKENMHEREMWLIKSLNLKLTGYFNYYGITDNGREIQRMRRFVVNTLFKSLRKRSNRHRLTWESYSNIFKTYLLVKAKVSVNIYEIMGSLNLSKL